MGLFTKLLWGEPRLEAAPTGAGAQRFSGTLDDDCDWGGPGTYSVYVVGVDEPVHVGHSGNLRQAIRWTRYQFSRDNQFPSLVSLRWEAVATASVAEAEATALQPLHLAA
jgi:hypothetical protein